MFLLNHKKKWSKDKSNVIGHIIGTHKALTHKAQFNPFANNIQCIFRLNVFYYAVAHIMYEHGTYITFIFW